MFLLATYFYICRCLFQIYNMIINLNHRYIDENVSKFSVADHYQELVCELRRK